MARTYSNAPTLSKIKFPGSNNTYWLKDADARAILDGINDGVYNILKNALGTVGDGGDHLVSAGNIKEYVDQIAELGFDVEKVAASVVADATAAKYETYHNKIVLVEDASSETGACVEYVILRAGEVGSYTYSWERIGTTQVDLNEYLTSVDYNKATHTLTKTNGANGTVNVNVFGDLADADTASASYTPAGNISQVQVMDSVGTQAAFVQGEDQFVQGEDQFTANVPTALDLTKFNGGSKAADTWNAGALPSKAADTWNAGALPSKQADVFNAGSLPSLGNPTKSSFTYEGVTVGLDAEDSECLKFTNARTNEAVTVQGAFNAGALPSYSEGAFNAGSLPSFKEGAFNAGSLPSFTEGAFIAASLADGFYTPGVAAEFEQGNDSFNQGNDNFTANVLPTKKNVTPTFTGTAATITVSPDPEE